MRPMMTRLFGLTVVLLMLHIVSPAIGFSVPGYAWSKIVGWTDTSWQTVRRMTIVTQSRIREATRPARATARAHSPDRRQSSETHSQQTTATKSAARPTMSNSLNDRDTSSR